MYTFSDLVKETLALSTKHSLTNDHISKLNQTILEYHRDYNLAKDIMYREYKKQHFERDPRHLLIKRDGHKIISMHKNNNQIRIPRVKDYSNGLNTYVTFWYEDIDGYHVITHDDTVTAKVKYIPPRRKYFSSKDLPPCKWNYDIGYWEYLQTDRTYSNIPYDEVIGKRQYDNVTEWLIQEYPDLLKLAVQVKIGNLTNDQGNKVLYSQLKEQEASFLTNEEN